MSTPRLGLSQTRAGGRRRGKRGLSMPVGQRAGTGQCEQPACCCPTGPPADHREQGGDNHPQNAVIGGSGEKPHGRVEHGRAQCSSAFHDFDVASDNFSANKAHTVTLCCRPTLSSRDLRRDRSTRVNLAFWLYCRSVQRRIMGIETEFGVTCTFHGHRRLSPTRLLVTSSVVSCRGVAAPTSSSVTEPACTWMWVRTRSTRRPSATASSSWSITTVPVSVCSKNC